MHDLRYAARTLLRTPGFSIVAILALALGIGASTAVFSVIDEVLLRPLPYADAGSVMRVHNEWEGTPRAGISPAEYFDYLNGTREVFTALGVWATSAVNVTGGEVPERVPAAFLSAGVLPALGIAAELGRTFSTEEDRPGGNAVVILSHGFWQRRFGRDASVMGRDIIVNDRAVTIIGTLPAEFRLPDQFDAQAGADLYLPLALDPAGVPNRGSHFLSSIARLAPGVPQERAGAALRTVAARFVERFPDDYPRDMRFGVHILPVRDDVIGSVRPVLLVLLGAVGFVLLIACANVASLVLTRADTRRRELAVRAALGAGRARIVKQLLVESLLLAAIGGASGVLLAAWGTAGVVALQPPDIPRIEGVGIDPAVLVFALGATLLTGVLFGLMPALTWRADSYGALRESARGTTSSGGRQRFRRALIVTELALALVLLAGAGLLLRSFMGLMTVDPGYDRQNALTVRLSLPGARYESDEQRRVFYRGLVERVSALPAVSAAGAVSNLPLSSVLGDLNIEVEGRPRREGEVSARLDWQVVTPGYFEAMGMRLVRGRDILASDDGRAPGAVVINETAARTIFPGEDPLGRRFTLGAGAGPGEVTVVGVVADVRHAGLHAQPTGEMYIPHEQYTMWHGGRALAAMTLVARTSVEPTTLAAAVRGEIAALDPELPASAFQTLERVAAQSIARSRFIMTLLGAFATIALLLAAIGIYGIIAYAVSLRTHEMGIRIALGARRGQVIRLVLRQGITVIAAGIALGLACALALTRSLSGLLYDITPHDPATLFAVSAALALVALSACIAPAHRASRVDPAEMLRND